MHLELRGIEAVPPVAAAWSSVSTPSRLRSFLDQAAEGLAAPETIPWILPALTGAAAHLHRLGDRGDWQALVRSHRVTDLLREAPATDWALRQPRGYAGDPYLLDLLDDHPAVSAVSRTTSVRGQVMHGLLAQFSVAVAQRDRRTTLARLLDATAERVRQPEALVLGCGHMREAEQARHLDRFGRIVALDQDADSIAEVRRSHGGVAALVPAIAPLGRLLRRPLTHGRFDLIYAGDLYEDLDDPTAAGLTEALFGALKPGGRLVFANLGVEMPELGFLDAFLDWRLQPRGAGDLHRLLRVLPRADVAEVRVSGGDTVVYAAVQRR